jgi:hypothetical protein
MSATPMDYLSIQPVDQETMTIMALGIVPGLLLGWIAFCVAEISAAHPEITRRRGCRSGTCKLT